MGCEQAAKPQAAETLGPLDIFNSEFDKVAKKNLTHPPFPPLTWDDYSWTGEVTLPSWAGFQARRGSYGSVSSTKPSDGTARLNVVALNSDARTPPTPEQDAAFQYLLDNEAAVAAAVISALFEYYPSERGAYLDAYDLEEADEVPEIADATELRSLVGLSTVHVLTVARDGMACIGFEFGCVWDTEHGAGVITHRGRVLGTGQADCSFVAWMAQEGLDKHSGG